MRQKTVVRLYIPRKVVSWNVIIAKGFWQRSKLFNEWKRDTALAAKAAGLQPFTAQELPVAITFRALWKHKRRHDVDALVCKPVLDALVDAGILPDDSTEYVERVTYTGATGCPADGLEVTIQPG